MHWQNEAEFIQLRICPSCPPTRDKLGPSFASRQLDREEREWTCLLQIYDVSDGQSLDGSLAFPTIQCKCQRKKRRERRERESQFREFPLSATRASQDRRFYGRTSKRHYTRKNPLIGQPKVARDEREAHELALSPLWVQMTIPWGQNLWSSSARSRWLHLIWFINTL